MTEKKTQPDELITETALQAAGNVQDILKGKVGKPVDVAGQKVDPQKAYENLRTALELLKNFMDFDPNDLCFQKFAGETVGEARGEKIVVDPLMLMHPAARLAHVIAHEAAHMGGDVDNEGLVECFVRTMETIRNDGASLTDRYNKAMENFYEFINRIAEGRPVNEVVTQVYNLYYKGEYEAIYKLYETNFIEKFKSDKDRNAAFAFFTTVFPELQVTDGNFSTEKVTSEAREDYDLRHREGAPSPKPKKDEPTIQ